MFDSVLNSVLLGVIGEFYLSGVGFVCGYYDCVVMIVECFLFCLVGVGVGGCMYCIGDIVWFLFLGELEYLGCSDY